MRIVFFGSGEFGLPTLEALLAAGHDIAAVVSQPDRPAGRGGKTRPTPIRAFAESVGLRVLCPETPNTPGFEAELVELAPELAVVVAYGHRIKKPLLAIPPLGFVNLHASLLPAYRGAAPVPWAILSGEKESGATIFRLDERFDTGAILSRVVLPIGDDDTSGSYLAKLAPLGGGLMADTVAALASGTAVAQPQDDARASAAPKFAKEDGRIDWNRPFAEIERTVRALQPWPQAHTVLPTAKGDLRIKVARLEPVDGETGTPGAVLHADAAKGLIIATADTAARLAALQPEGKRVMADTEFLRGTTVTK